MKKNRVWRFSLLAVALLLMASITTVAFATSTCNHERGNYTSLDAEKHSYACKYCGGEQGTEDHNFEKIGCEKKCTLCGYTEYEHTYEEKTVAPTCTEGGYTKYTCTGCGDSYKTNKTSKLYHWFGEWTPNGDDTHSANCKREGCKNVGTVDCETFEYLLNGTAIVFCPVCGEVENGTHLDLIEEADAASEDLPKGEPVLRANGELMSVGYEYSGKLTQPTEPMTITLPAEIVNGHTLSILAADGTETTLETTADGETVSFTLDFGETPVVLIHMA